MTSSWAVVGCGRVAPAHVTSLRRAGAEVVAAVEPDRAAARKFAVRYGLPVWPTVQAMLAAGAPDAATVAAPHDVHRAVIDELLHAGVAVLSEKPLARTPAECLAIIDAEQATGLPVGTILNMRGLPYARALRRAVAGGRLTVRSIAISGNLVRRPLDVWQSDPHRAGGGILMEVGIHYLDLCAWWFGDPVSGRCTLEGTPVEHSADVVAGFASGVTVTMSLRAVHDAGHPVAITVTADEGVVTIAGAQVLSGAELLAGPGAPETAELSAVPAVSADLPFGDGHLRVISEAAELFDRQGRFPVTARDGALSVVMTCALYSGNEDLAAATAAVSAPCKAACPEPRPSARSGELP